MEEPSPRQGEIDFKNTQIAFGNKSDKELKKMHWLFNLMKNNWLTNIGSTLGLWAVKLRLPFAETAIKNTIFEQFVGGENLLDCQSAIDKLYKYGTLTILDYGAEGKSNEEDLDHVRDENIKAIEMAASNDSVPIITTKITGLVANEILVKLQAGGTLSPSEQEQYDRLVSRVDDICKAAHEHRVGVFIDAEESWIQQPIDDLAMQMMLKYNVEGPIVFNTYQLYRHDKLEQLKRDHKTCVDNGVYFSLKIVRGAYMIKERARAIEKGYPSPIQVDKAATDRDFNAALEYCVRHHDTISIVNATHNVNSTNLMTDLIRRHNYDKEHPHLNFCQLYGMSDFITFNLANAGYNVAKYVPYGPVKEVIPYLIRRAQENSSVTGEMTRELSMIKSEMKRRGLK